MENVYYDVKTDSTVDNVIEPSDHADARAPDKVEDPILVGSLNYGVTMSVVPHHRVGRPRQDRP